MARWFVSASLAVLGWPSVPATAQPTIFHGPISGFVYNHGSRTIRPVLGVPGSASLGLPILDEVDFASVGPNGRWALVAKSGRRFFVRGLSDLTPVDSTADGLIDAVDRVLWNRDGSIALLYSSSSNRLQRVRLSEAGIVADTSVDLAPWGTATALAIDPAGQQVAFGAAGAGLYLFQAGQSPALLSSMAHPVAAAFDGDGRRLYAVDLDQQRISSFESGATALEFAVFAQPDVASTVKPVGLAVSGDGRYLLLTDKASASVRVYDVVSGGLLNTIPLDFTPSRFESLSSAPTFLLNGDNSKEWLLILDARQLPGVSFVPANQEVAQ